MAEGLVGKLEGVNVGDIIRLETSNGDKVAGFVSGISKRRIKLSHEDPNNESDSYVDRFTRGDRWYRLGNFNKYEVIDSKRQ
jgi:translation initiation factor IF-1